MDGSTAKRTDVDVLKSLIAGLLSLAGMAERAASRSFPIRVLILWILSRSESLAWRHIPDDVLSPFIVHHRYSRIHAQHFAWLFKTAAYWLKRKLREKERFARKWAKWETRQATDNAAPEPRVLTLPLVGRVGAKRRGGGMLACSQKLHDLFFPPAPRLDSS